MRNILIGTTSCYCWLVLLLWTTVAGTVDAFLPSTLAPNRVSMQTIYALSNSRSDNNSKKSQRASDIRRTINQLKKEGRLKKKKNNQSLDDDNDDDAQTQAQLSDIERVRKNRERLQQSTSVAEQYAGKLKRRLGSGKSRFYGYLEESDDDDEEEEEETRQGRLGSLERSDNDDVTEALGEQDDDENSESNQQQQQEEEEEEGGFYVNPDLVQEEKPADPSDEDLVDLVVRKMEEKRRLQRQQEEEERKEKARQRQQQMLEETNKNPSTTTTNNNNSTKTTTGVGGSWQENSTAKEETYRPSRGSWGYFERPKDISKAYGGGRRVGAGYQQEQQRSDTDRTKMLLKRYREKVGLEVESERDHKAEIEEALRIGELAMQRGMYSTGVSALEKVTKWCSSESKVGGKVLLELAMAYEANGRTTEAVTIYRKLTESRVVDIRQNAKKLLYGIEAMEFMRNEAKSEAFQRNKVRKTFIDATGMDRFASNFDDVYMTGYINLESGVYRKLTQAVVRSPREARQVLLRAIDAGIVTRMKVVQALTSLSRGFDKALRAEIEAQEAPTAFLDGVPIAKTPNNSNDNDNVAAADRFVLASPQQMMDNLQGEWRLQLLADRSGDGVRYYNKTLSWQQVDTETMRFHSCGPAGPLVTVSECGALEFDETKRVLCRLRVETMGAPPLLLSMLPRIEQRGGASSTIPQQIISVDSVLLVTRCVVDKPKSDEKDYFAVWRRVDDGTFFSPTTT